MSDEDWVKAAMADDSVVVDLLVRLNQATPPKLDSPAFPLEWSVRQRRSKPVMLQPKKLKARASPTTPLSWSGATSHSGGGGGPVDGFEESSRPAPNQSNISRSKGTGTNETATTKRSKKKKTLSELKEEETLLLKDRRQLKRDLATLHSNMEKQRAANESLKRMKLDLQSRAEVKRVSTVASEKEISELSQQKTAATNAVPPPLITASDLDVLPKPSPQVDAKKEPRNHETKIALPDLNLPLDEDVASLNVMS